MKKKLMAIAAVFCCAMTMTVFTACGDDDDKPYIDNKKPVAVSMNYAFETTSETLNVFDLTIEYYDANGTVQTEQMTNTQWQKSLRTKIPTTVGARLLIKLKDGVDVASMEKVTVSYGYEYKGHPVSADNSVAGTVIGGSSGTNLTMKGDNVSEYLAKHSDGLVKYLYKYASDGNAESGSW